MDDLAAPATPPGWYPDPKMAGTQRYWDGGKWTENAAPMQQAAQAPGRSIDAMKADYNLERAGWLTAILLPFVGVVLGIILAARGNGKGVQVILLSVAVMVVAGIVLSGRSGY